MSGDLDQEARAAALNAALAAFEAEVQSLTTRAEVARLRYRLDLLLAAEPDNPLPETVSRGLNARARYEAIGALAVRRWRECAAREPEPEWAELLDPDGPDVTAFFCEDAFGGQSGRGGADQQAIRAAETRLGVELPGLLRRLYGIRDGGPTDFIWTPRRSGAPLRFEGGNADEAFFAAWRETLPGQSLAPLARLATLGELADGAEEDPDYSWRAHLPDANRLVVIGSHGWDVFLCLDYAVARDRPPGVVLFNDARWTPGEGTPWQASWPSFDALFGALRRQALTVQDGLLVRGLRRLGLAA